MTEREPSEIAIRAAKTVCYDHSLDGTGDVEMIAGDIQLAIDEAMDDDTSIECQRTRLIEANVWLKGQIDKKDKRIAELEGVLKELYEMNTMGETDIPAIEFDVMLTEALNQAADALKGE